MADFSDSVEEGVVDSWFTSVTPSPGQAKRIRSLRAAYGYVARHVLRECPPSFERDKALRALDSASSWAAKAILRHE